MPCCERVCNSQPAQHCCIRLGFDHHARVDSGLPHSTSSRPDSPRSLLPARTQALLSPTLSLLVDSFRRCLIVSLCQQLTLSPGHLLWPTAFAVAWSFPLANSSHCPLVVSVANSFRHCLVVSLGYWLRSTLKATVSTIGLSPDRMGATW
jgi:hypothetical protein